MTNGAASTIEELRVTVACNEVTCDERLNHQEVFNDNITKKVDDMEEILQTIKRHMAVAAGLVAGAGLGGGALGSFIATTLSKSV